MEENKLTSSSSDNATNYSADEDEVLLYPEKFYTRSTIPNSFKNHWLLSQNNHSSSNFSITDHSDIEFSGNESDDDSLFSVNPGPEMEQFQSTINCYLNQIKNKRSKGKLFLCPSLPDDDEGANCCAGNGTDDELISVSGKDFRQIANEEFENNHGGRKLADHKFMTVKTHQTTTTKTNKIKPIYPKEIEKIPSNFLIPSEDSTDESDLDVSINDYYKIRHQNQVMKKLQVDYIISSNDKPRISSKQQSNNDLETSEEDEVDILATGDSKLDSKVSKNIDDASCESEVEVNMKDYYVIRHETAAKSVSGPVEIDFGYAISHHSFLNGGCRGKKFIKKRKKSSSTKLLKTSHLQTTTTTTGKGNISSMTTVDNNFTDVEELFDDEEKKNNKLMTYQEFLKSLKISRSEQCLVKKSTFYQDGISADDDDPKKSDLSDDTYSLAANSNLTDNSDELGGSKTDKPEYSKKLLPPIIRLIEVEGLQGAVGVICQKNSPTSDDVYGIKFMQNEEEQGSNHLLF